MVVKRYYKHSQSEGLKQVTNMQKTNNPTSLPWTKDQFQQMQTMLNETIPLQEDNLKRAKASGLNVDDLMQQLQQHKTQLKQMIDAWKDKY